MNVVKVFGGKGTAKVRFSPAERFVAVNERPSDDLDILQFDWSLLPDAPT